MLIDFTVIAAIDFVSSKINPRTTEALTLSFYSDSIFLPLDNWGAEPPLAPLFYKTKFQLLQKSAEMLETLFSSWWLLVSLLKQYICLVMDAIVQLILCYSYRRHWVILLPALF